MSAPDPAESAEAYLPLIRPAIDFADFEADLREVFRSGMLTRGPFLDRFEAAFATRVGAAHAVAVTSATTALHLALVAAGIGSGDEVLVSDFTFPASGNVVIQTGATPVLIDCLPGRFELDVEQAAARVTSRTKAIVHVDPFGRPADLAAIEELCAQHGLFALEDAACAVGSGFAGRPVGSWPGATAFSFHPRKLLTTGEGGAVTTDDGALADRMRLLRNHGQDGATFVEPGFNYRMNEIQAVMGLSQLRGLDELLAERRSIAQHYEQLVQDVEGIELAPTDPRAHVNYQSFVVWLPAGTNRAELQRLMREERIETTLGTYAMHAHRTFGSRTGLRPGDLPHSFAAQERTLTLPVVPRMSPEQIERVCGALATALERSRDVVGA